MVFVNGLSVVTFFAIVGYHYITVRVRRAATRSTDAVPVTAEAWGGTREGWRQRMRMP